MNFSKQYLIELANQTKFIKDNLEKVLRLAEILKFINNDPILKNKLALKGMNAPLKSSAFASCAYYSAFQGMDIPDGNLSVIMQKKNR